MSIVIGGIRCEELRDGFSEGISWEEGPSATKMFLVPNWADRYTVCNALLGLSTYVFVGGHLTIQSPGSYPDSANMIARRISIKGLGAVTNGPRQFQFTSAAVTVEYGVPQWQGPGGDPNQSLDANQPMVFATQKIRFAGQWLSIQGSSLRSAAGPLTENFARFVGVNDLSVTFFQFPFLPPPAMRSVVGKMNNAYFFGAATGTLMLTGIDTNSSGSTDGTFNQEVTMNFSERPEAAWDKTYRSVGWQTVTTAAGDPVIPSADYRLLIPAFYLGL
jgi:hypothetical protein